MTPHNYTDLSGQKFGLLEVVCRVENKHDKAQWYCLCDCGSHNTTSTTYLKQGRVKSCGCLQKALLSNRLHKHGQTGSKLFHVWEGMKQRCSNKNHISYPSYGERGIGVCKEWRDSFDKFKSWAKENGYGKGQTIERLDVNKGYSPSNCTFIPKSEQSRNKTCNVLSVDDIPTIRVMHNEGLSQTAIAKLFSVSKHVIYSVVKNKSWSAC